MTEQKTVKQTAEEDLAFIGKVVKKSMDVLDTSWDMTVLGAAMLGVVCQGNPGMALYMLNKIGPQPNSLITDDDIIREFPFGFEGDWETTWDQFRTGDQRAVFKR